MGYNGTLLNDMWVFKQNEYGEYVSTIVVSLERLLHKGKKSNYKRKVF